MDKEVTVGIATAPGQWIGYWGYDFPEIPARRLESVTHRIANGVSWSVVSRIPTTGILVTLSASGIASDRASPDAWVLVGEDSLTLGRQAFGRVPLYWTRQKQTIWFASRLRLLLPLLGSPSVDLAALYGYSCFSYVPTPLTPIEEIQALEAGREESWRIEFPEELLISSSRGLTDWRENPHPIESEEVAIAELQTLLQQSIERQLADLSDEPVGVFLSGGLDSSIVAALLVRSGITTRAYTLDFGEIENPESPYAEKVAEYLKIPLTKVKATPQQIGPALIPAIRALDLPFGDGVTVPLFLLGQAARQDTRVIFNGEGGDQLFAGWTNKPMIAAGIYQSESPDGDRSFEEDYLRTFHRLYGYEERVFQPEVFEEIRSIDPRHWLKTALDSAPTPSLLHRLRRASLMLKGAQNIQPRATNLAFAHGLQVRSPFCDPDLAEWTFSLSGELFLQGSREKYILKRAVESWLPPEIVWREKRGMGVPLTPWCLQEWWRSLGIWLNPGRLKAEGRWQSDLAVRIVSGELGGMIQGRRVGEILWLLIVWELWRSNVLGEPEGNLSWNHPFWLVPHSLWKYGKQWR
ncbi:asparagine synthetase B family protein [Pannus brasiliensis CCIBt3594]|uniref:asparagine synthase (glutamine-hydrolyzing) n=1 Tax=Pannus brasiliensis CCIBt3594 TaxID=1427578 RepID=A0AAW9QLL4_9CHRO